MFADGTFYIAPIFGYQVFITRIYAPEIKSFYTTLLSILNNKEQATYELSFEELKKNASKYNNIIVTPKILHCDFEKSISNASYIFDIYNHIKIICQIYNYFYFLNFLEYFNKTYLYK